MCAQRRRSSRPATPAAERADTPVQDSSGAASGGNTSPSISDISEILGKVDGVRAEQDVLRARLDTKLAEFDGRFDRIEQACGIWAWVGQ